MSATAFNTYAISAAIAFAAFCVVVGSVLYYMLHSVGKHAGKIGTPPTLPTLPKVTSEEIRQAETDFADSVITELMSVTAIEIWADVARVEAELKANAYYFNMPWLPQTTGRVAM